MRDLLTEVSKAEGLRLELVSCNWDNLLGGLEQKRYDAALSTMMPMIENQSTYLFSEPLLRTGPVLVVTRESKIKDLKELEGKIIAIERTSLLLDFFQEYPRVIQEYYQTPTDALQGLERGMFDAALIDLFVAHNSVGELFPSLEIATYPYTEEGIRIITTKNANMILINKMNKGLEEIIHSDRYQELLEKWGLF